VKQATRLCCKPCSKLSLDLFVRDTFSAIELVDSLLDGGQKFDPLSYLVQRNFIGQLADSFQDKSFLRHIPNIRPRSRRSKFEIGNSKEWHKKRSWLACFNYVTAEEPTTPISSLSSACRAEELAPQ
jgi:hypothetical protein